MQLRQQHKNRLPAFISPQFEYLIQVQRNVISDISLLVLLMQDFMTHCVEITTGGMTQMHHVSWTLIHAFK
jgi:hypothetical protein